MSENNEKVKNLISMGTELSGTAAGGALGFLVGGPIEAAGAAVAGLAISKISNFVLIDIADRVLSKREQVRVGAAASLAIEKIREYLESGKSPRNDDFFEHISGSRPKAEEIFEGILLKSKNEHEEKKLKYISSIFANTVFMSDVSLSEANHMLHIAEGLTYNQLCLLSLFERKSSIPEINLRENDYTDWNEATNGRTSLEIEMPNSTKSVIQEIFELYNFGLVQRIDPGDKDSHSLLDCGYVAPNRMFLTDLGRRYYTIMGLAEIIVNDLMNTADSLS
jgi:hypothetical protein